MKIITPILILFVTLSCADLQQGKENEIALTALKSEVDSLRNLVKSASGNTKSQIATFLTFQESNAEEAMNFYVGLFENSKITHIQRYGKEGPGKEGTIFFATFELNGSQFACSDSFIKHEWDFTPGVSNWVACKSNEELDTLFAKLSENGSVMMPVGNYGFSQKFAFVEDRFGVSWQLNLE